MYENYEMDARTKHLCELHRADQHDLKIILQSRKLTNKRYEALRREHEGVQ